MDIFVEFGDTFTRKKTEFVFQLYFLLVILFLILNDCWNLSIDLQLLENRTNRDFGFLSFKNSFHFIPEWMNVYVDLPSNKISTLLRNYGVSPVSVYYCHSILKQITWFAVQAKWIVSIWNPTEYWAERVHIWSYSSPYFPALGSNTERNYGKYRPE